jgi:hypothetical protein
MTRGKLIHPHFDVLLLGGASLICSILFYVSGLQNETLGPYFIYALLLFSYPHFMASMKVFYFQPGVLRQHPFIGIWIPLAMILFFFGIAYTGSSRALMASAQVAVLLLYWHFLKQSYGVSLWLSANSPKKMLETKKKLLLIGCLFFGAYGYLGSQQQGGNSRVFRTDVPSFHLQHWAITLFGVLSYVVMGAFVIWSIRDLLKDRENADFQWPGFIPLAAMITWFEPHFNQSPVTYLLPIFHAMQYMPFPVRGTLNENPGPKSTLRFALYLVGLVLVGGLLFEALPYAGAHLFTSTDPKFIFGGISLFINLHHYFIDSVIWRFRNPAVMKRLAPIAAY